MRGSSEAVSPNIHQDPLKFKDIFINKGFLTFFKIVGFLSTSCQYQTFGWPAAKAFS
jgi:hypothetical protein